MGLRSLRIMLSTFGESRLFKWSIGLSEPSRSRVLGSVKSRPRTTPTIEFASPKPMRQKYPRGHFQKLIKEGKLKIQFASTKKIRRYEEVAPDFLERIFDMDRRSCLISDESSLWDFRTDQSKKTIWRRIRETYGLDVSDVADGNLVTILKRIDWQRKPSC